MNIYYLFHCTFISGQKILICKPQERMWADVKAGIQLSEAW